MVDNRPREPRTTSGNNNTLYFIVGALVIAVLIIGWFMYGGNETPGNVDVNVSTPSETTAPAMEPATPAAPEPAPMAPAPEPAPAAPAPAPAPSTTTQ